MTIKKERMIDLGTLVKDSGLIPALVKDLGIAAKRAKKMAKNLEEKGELKPMENPFTETGKLGVLLRGVIDKQDKKRRESLKTRSEALQQSVEFRRKRLEAYAKRKRVAVPAKEDRFVVTGQVVDQATGQGIPNVTVRAVDMDRKFHDLLGVTRTDALGYYRIEYTEADIDEADKKPETFIEVLGDEEQVLFTSPKSFIEKASKTETIDASINGNQVPDKLSLGQSITRFVDNKINRFENKRRLMEGRKILNEKKVRTKVKRPKPVLSVSEGEKPKRIGVIKLGKGITIAEEPTEFEVVVQPEKTVEPKKLSEPKKTAETKKTASKKTTRKKAAVKKTSSKTKNRDE